MLDARRFLEISRRGHRAPFRAVSLFSGAGLSDLGFELAGFRMVVQSELDQKRADLAAENFPASEVVVGDIRETSDRVIRAYREATRQQLDLLVATPPCQGMSSANPGRGKVTIASHASRDLRNFLILAAAPVVRALRPRVIVIENVPQLLARMVRLKKHGPALNLVTELFSRVTGYKTYTGTLQLADFGVPQLRRRSIIVMLRDDQEVVERLDAEGRVPWPEPTHHERALKGCSKWISARAWLRKMRYRPLDAASAEAARDESDPLHQVPHYDDGRYEWIADIPAGSGKSAYENERCRSCARRNVPSGLARCDRCGKPMKNRPVVLARNGRYRLIRGFKTSYRRIKPDRPFSAITTASSHLGSDFKIHPFQNRVLSTREVADLQTVPRFYRWERAIKNGNNYLLREVIGEALPTWLAYQHGRVIRALLEGRSPREICAKGEMAPAAERCAQPWTTDDKKTPDPARNRSPQELRA